MQEKLKEKNVNLSLVESWEYGGNGAKDLAKKVVDLAQKETKLNNIYELEQPIETKIEKLSKTIYGAEGIEISDKAQEEIDFIKKIGYNNLPICIAKTQYSFSDDPKDLECEKPFKIHVQEVRLNAGAEFIVVITGKTFTMPGLPKQPAAEKIDIDEEGNIVGIF